MFKRISRFVRLIRAQNRCEQCGIGNYTVLHYHKDEIIDQSDPFEAYQLAQAHLIDWFSSAYFSGNESDHRMSIVVLAVAHLDHDITNNELDNLLALCQRCHLGFDRKDNAQRRRYGAHGRHFMQLVMTFDSAEGKLMIAKTKRVKRRKKPKSIKTVPTPT